MISEAKIRETIHDAGFPEKKRDVAAGIITTGLGQFREYEKNWYYSHTGKKIKKPGPTPYYQKTNQTYRK